MRKIFIRMGMTPMEGWTPDKVLLEDAIGGNAGNLIYQYSICRTLMTENTELIPSRYRYSPRQADEINHTCSHVVIPLADAFRATFTGGLKRLTKLVRAVKVPCVVIGAGLRAPLGTISYADFPFNTQARDFVKAVLDKSPVISIRGEQTAEYLKYLGFVPEKDFTVTGCPSFYLFGDRLEVRDISREKEGRICVNANPRLGPVSYSFLYRILRDCPESVFIPQLQTEFRMIYTGAPAIYEYHSAEYPYTLRDAVYQEGRVRFFSDAGSWMDYLSESRLTIGARIHGNIASILAGTPNILVMDDVRVEELARYHKLNAVYPEDLGKGACLETLIENADYEPMRKAARKNFLNYVRFLDRCGLDHIYKDGKVPDTCPFDKIISKVPKAGPIKPVTAISWDELLSRWDAFYPQYDTRYEQYRQSRSAYQRRVETLPLPASLQKKLLKI